MSAPVDHVAAKVHRARAEISYQDAEKFRKLGLVVGERAALEAARYEDEIADLLSGVARRSPGGAS